MARLDFRSAYPYQSPPERPRGLTKPLVPVRLHNGRLSTLEILALVDSGADVSAFHVSLAHQLHVDLADCRRVAMRGAGGMVSTHRCEVEIDVEGLRFPADVLFVASRIGLLGREDVFMQFKFAVDQRARRLLIEPYEG